MVVRPCLGVGVILLGARTVDEEAVGEQVVVHPVGAGGAHRGDGDVVDEEHHDDKDRKAEDAVRDDLVDLLGRGELLGRLHDAGVHDAGDPLVAVRGDDGLGVVLTGLLDGLDVDLEGLELGVREAERLDGGGVALEDLDGKPAVERGLALAGDASLDLGEGGLDLVGEHAHRSGGLAGLAGLDGELHELVGVLLAQGGDLDHLAAQLAGQGVDVDLVAALLEQVKHVEAEHDGQAALEDLRGEIEVALEVRRVNEVDDGARAVLDEVVARDDLLGRVRRERVDAGKVGEGDGLVTPPVGLLLLDRDAGPVAHVAVRAGQGVEQRGLAAVRVACERDVHAVFHDSLSWILAGGGVGPLVPFAGPFQFGAEVPM